MLQLQQRQTMPCATCCRTRTTCSTRRSCCATPTRYLDARKGASPKKRYLLYERALNALPGSYKVPPPARPAALPPALLLRCPALLQHALLLLQRLHPRRADPCLCLPSRSPQPSPYTHPHPLNPHTPTRPRSSGMPT